MTMRDPFAAVPQVACVGMLEDELGGSPGSVTNRPDHISSVLTVLPAYGRAKRTRPNAALDNARLVRRNATQSKRLLSWADVAGGRQRE